LMAGIRLFSETRGLFSPDTRVENGINPSVCFLYSTWTKEISLDSNPWMIPACRHIEQFSS
jgi:hypothetical protein